MKKTETDHFDNIAKKMKEIKKNVFKKRLKKKSFFFFEK